MYSGHVLFDGHHIDVERMKREEGISLNQINQALASAVRPAEGVVSLEDVRREYDAPETKAGSPYAYALIKSMTRFYRLTTKIS